MGMVDMVSNGIASITGSVAKASIYIKDNRENWEADQKKVQDCVSSGGNMTDALGSVGAKVNGSTNTKSTLKNLGDKLTGGALSNLGMNKEKKLAVAMSRGYNKVFEVQFNPDSLELSASDYGASMNYDYSSGKSDKNSNKGINMALNAKLIFVKDDLSEAFPSDTMSLSATQGARAVGKLAKKVFSSERPSIQIIVEGFIGALRSPFTRRVAFAWGDLLYEGILKNVNASYTLFDTSGRPVRAEVQLSIYLMDPEIKPGDRPSLGYWQAAYDDAFSSSASYVGKVQQVVEKAQKFIGG